MRFSNVRACIGCATTLSGILLCAIAAGAPALSRLGPYEHADEPTAPVRPHVHMPTAVDWDPQAALASEARRSVVSRRLDGARVIGASESSTAQRNLPQAAEYATRLSGFGPVVGPRVNEPDWMQSARQVRRQGVPLLRPWQNSKMFISLGVSARGVPGIYLVQKIAH